MIQPQGLEWKLPSPANKPQDKAPDSTTLKEHSSSDDEQSTVQYQQLSKPKDITWFDGGQKQNLLDKFITYQTSFNHSSSFAHHKTKAHKQTKSQYDIVTGLTRD